MTTTTSPLRILYIADSTSIHTVRWIRFFAERGHKVALCSQSPLQHGLEVDRFSPLSTRGGLPGTRLLSNVREVRRAIRAFKPDVIHAHYINESGWLGALSGFRPFALTAWGSDIYLAPKQSKLAAKLSPWSVARADYVTADSFDQIEQLKKMGARHTEMIGWGVELDAYPRAIGDQWRQQRDISDDQIMVLSPRQWIGNSNIDIIVQAWAKVRKACPDALLILKRMKGEAPFNARIEAQIAALKLGASVRIVEEMPESDLPAMYAAADIAVSVCSSDGTPVSVLEAMAAATPVIAGELPSLSEWVKNQKTGFLVAPRDADALAARLVELIQNGELRAKLGARARQIAVERAGREENLAKIETALIELALSVTGY